MQSCENLLSWFIAPEKTVGPETELPFVRITLDSIRMEAWLSDEKLKNCRVMLLDFYKWHKVTLCELQSIIGLLNFTCSVVLPGRAFLQRLIDLARGIQRPHFKIRFKQRRQKRFNCLAIILGAIQWSHIFSGWTNVRSTIWNYFRCSQFQNVLIFIFT